MKRAKQRNPFGWRVRPPFVMFMHTDNSYWYEQLRSVTEKYTDSPVLMKGQLVQTEGVRIVETPPDIEAMASAIESINLRKLSAQRMANWIANQAVVYGHAAYQLSVDQDFHMNINEIPMPSIVPGRATRD